MYILFYAQIYSHRYFFTYHKGYSVYADGLIEQWGGITTNGVNTFSFLIQYNIIPIVIADWISNTTPGSAGNHLQSITKTGFTYMYGSQATTGNIGIPFIAIGY